MSGISSVRQLVLLIFLLGYGNKATRTGDGSSNSSQRSAHNDSPTSTPQMPQSNSPYTPLSSSEISSRNLHRSGAAASDSQLGDIILKLRAVRERPFRPRTILPEPTMLRKLNVKMLDGEYFSIQRPKNPLRDRVILYFPINQIPANVRRFVRRFMRSTFGEDRSQHKRTARALKSYLSNYSVCPVKYKWHDFGQRYWPRWVRLGACFNRRPSCSIPEGMKCRPDKVRTLTVLRYLCPYTWKSSDCDWRPIKFRVLMSCACGC